MKLLSTILGINQMIIKGANSMPSKQLVILVNRLKKSGIQISFTKPRTNISSYLFETIDLSKQKKI